MGMQLFILFMLVSYYAFIVYVAFLMMPILSFLMLVICVFSDFFQDSSGLKLINFIDFLKWTNFCFC